MTANSEESRGIAGTSRLALLIGSALAFAVRMIPWRLTDTPNGPMLPDGDAYYHLRRVLDGIRHFPHILDFDRYMNFPVGAPPIWPPMLDRAVAALALVTGGSGDDAAATRLACLVPPVLGALAVLPTAWVAARLAGPAAAWITALGVALLPAHVAYSRFGFLDHHVAYSLVGMSLLALLASSGRNELSSRRWWPCVGVGALLGLGVACWPGAILFAPLLVLGAMTSWLPGSRDGGDGVRPVGETAVSFVIAAVVMWPDAATSHWSRRGEWTITTLSHLQPVLLCGGAALLGLLGMLRSMAHRRQWRPWRSMVSISAILLSLAAAAFATPSIRAAWEAARRWLTKDEDFQSRVLESLPLVLDHRGAWTLEFVGAFLGSWFWLAPLAWIALTLRAWHGTRMDRTLWIWFTALSILLVLQRRFGDLAGPLLVLGGAVAVSDMVLAFGDRLRASIRVRAGILVLFATALLLPGSLQTLRSLRSSDDPTAQGQVFAERRELLSLMRALRERSPETSGFHDSTQQPEYGVLGPWDVGHIITAVGRRPVVSNNFGDDIGQESFHDTIEFFRTEDPAVALEIATRREVRYVVSSLFYVRALTEDKRRRFQFRLHYADGREPKGPFFTDWRLLAETRFPEKEPAAAFKLWERVPAARLRGRTFPDQPVVAQARIRTNLGRTFPFATTTVSDGAGAYELRMPYCNEAGTWETGAVGAIQVRAPRLGLMTDLDVTESEVLAGSVLEVPELE